MELLKSSKFKSKSDMVKRELSWTHWVYFEYPKQKRHAAVVGLKDFEYANARHSLNDWHHKHKNKMQNIFDDVKSKIIQWIVK